MHAIQILTLLLALSGALNIAFTAGITARQARRQPRPGHPHCRRRGESPWPSSSPPYPPTTDQEPRIAGPQPRRTGFTGNDGITLPGQAPQSACCTQDSEQGHVCTPHCTSEVHGRLADPSGAYSLARVTFCNVAPPARTSGSLVRGYHHAPATQAGPNTFQTVDAARYLARRRLHELDELPAGQPVLAVPVDRGRLAARAVGAAHRRHRLAGPPPRRLNIRQQRLNPPAAIVLTAAATRPMKRVPADAPGCHATGPASLMMLLPTLKGQGSPRISGRCGRSDLKSPQGWNPGRLNERPSMPQISGGTP